MTKALGRYIVADPEVCHGKPTFAGTRILVAGVPEQVATGMDWAVIVDDWRGDLSKEGIAEAVRLAGLTPSALPRLRAPTPGRPPCPRQTASRRRRRHGAR